jgi:hypothetical protein
MDCGSESDAGQSMFQQIDGMRMMRIATGTICLLTAAVSGCATPPADYAATLSRQDPKWNTPQCVQIRAEAANYAAGEKQTIGWATGALLGPYGLGIAAAGKEHRAKQRKLFAREIHLRCSDQPLPGDLRIDPSATR